MVGRGKLLWTVSLVVAVAGCGGVHKYGERGYGPRQLTSVIP